MKGRTFLPLRQSLPWVSSGAVLAGDMSAMSALSNAFCIGGATLEFSGPMAAMACLLSMTRLAFCWPVPGWATSSSASILKVTPSTSLFLLAVLMASSAEFLMPWPRAESLPESGASTPITTVVLPPSPPPALSSREPQAVSVSAPAVTAVVMMSKER